MSLTQLRSVSGTEVMKNVVEHQEAIEAVEIVCTTLYSNTFVRLQKGQGDLLF